MFLQLQVWKSEHKDKLSFDKGLKIIVIIYSNQCTF